MSLYDIDVVISSQTLVVDPQESAKAVPPLGSVELRPSLLLYRISRPLHRNSQPKTESLLPVSACDHGRPEGSLRRRDGGGAFRPEVLLPASSSSGNLARDLLMSATTRSPCIPEGMYRILNVFQPSMYISALSSALTRSLMATDQTAVSCDDGLREGLAVLPGWRRGGTDDESVFPCPGCFSLQYGRSCCRWRLPVTTPSSTACQHSELLLPRAADICRWFCDGGGWPSAATERGTRLLTRWIQGNRFTGVLPAELGSLSNLQELVASDNSFSGRVPPSLVQLSQLFLLDLSSNSLSGEIPGNFGRFKRLTRLNLSHNHLTGIIPPEIGETSGMDMLDLSNNELSGGVPAQLQNLHPSAFNLSYNNLGGPLPRFFTASRYRESFLGNPGLCYGLCTRNADPDAIQRARINLAATILSTAAIILLIALAWFTYKYRIYKKRAAEIACEKATWVLTSFHRVDFDERDIVNSLDESNVIGQGAAGKVYRSVVGPRSETVAVKKLWATTTADGAAVDNSKDDDTFEAEVATLSRIRHKNIVKLFCSVTSRACRLLVYEYMPNGSLGDLLHGAKAGVLDWPARLKIAVHAAEGLCYLHHDCVPSIVHRDIKSNNILLDAEFGAKVADFGVAKTLGDDPATMSVIAGSCGYIAPEYAYTLHVTEKSDVFSFGVVILELVTGKSPMAPEIGEKDLVAWVCDNIDQNGAESVLDQKIVDQFKNEMRRVLNIGLLCVNKSPNNRPPMRSVVKLLLEVQGQNKPKAKKEEAPAF
ncbi:receptor-like protein kinase HSL1 [Lolium rigidum]|uniref:receptor-like protein kinase HSL1 n=1 Tax=Lolium rigidum TaxID=89674 RepID=UPI001F5C497D|nr:receptor-like protein kinase HSL1 [Lolium rigidum]